MTNQQRLLRKLGRLWANHPKLRLGQLMGNLALRQFDGDLSDPFFLTDSEAEAQINYALDNGFGDGEEE